jgi:hypothetical protein
MTSSIEFLYEEVNYFVPASHLFWACWAIHQSFNSDLSFDFLSYAEKRLSAFPLFLRQAMTMKSKSKMSSISSSEREKIEKIQHSFREKEESVFQIQQLNIPTTNLPACHPSIDILQ